MSIADEMRRLQEGLLPDEDPAGVGTVTLLGLCRGNAPAVSERICTVLGTVLALSSGPWPSEAEWRDVLPEWFLEASDPEMTPEEAEGFLKKWRAMTPEEQSEFEKRQAWALSDWLHWMQPSERQWEFWTCRSTDKNSVRLTIKVDSWPIAHGALSWLLRVSGADRVFDEEER